MAYCTQEGLTPCSSGSIIPRKVFDSHATRPLSGRNKHHKSAACRRSGATETVDEPNRTTTTTRRPLEPRRRSPTVHLYWTSCQAARRPKRLSVLGIGGSVAGRLRLQTVVNFNRVTFVRRLLMTPRLGR